MSETVEPQDRSNIRIYGVRTATFLAFVFADIWAVAICFRSDIAGVLGADRIGACTSLGLTELLCNSITSNGIRGTLLTTAMVVAALIAVRLYDPSLHIATIERSRRPAYWLGLNVAGIAFALSPYFAAALGMPASAISPWALGSVLAGTLIAGLALMFWLAEWRRIWPALRGNAGIVLAAIFVLPLAMTVIQSSSWALLELRDATFVSTAFLLRLLGEPVTADPEGAVIGIGDFRVLIASECSGIGGIALVSAGMAGYTIAMRRELRLARAILLIPAAALLSWLLNTVRLAVLLMIGAHFSPQLAIKGFHGAAGWISFCILSCLVLFAADRMAWFHRGPAKTVSAGFRSDSMAAEVVPFIVLLISSLAATASFLEPERAYPMRLAAMSVTLLAFAPVLRNTRWSFAPGAALAGIAIAVAWLAVKAGSPARSISDILGQVTPAEANFWVACRVLGTTFVIPIIEELFFRGYLMRRLDFGGKLGQATALLLSSTLFGALHEGFLLAAASGLVLAFVRSHRDRIADAIVAHATANATIAAFACWSGNWAVI